MLSHDRVPFSLGEDDPIHRLRAFLGHYDLRIYINAGSYIEADCGSFDAALRLGDSVAGDFEGCVGTVGRMCNFAPDCYLLGGGEHWNERPVNIVFANIPAVQMRAENLPELRPRPKRHFVIGNNVVISGGARVLQGAEIGDGAVIGANAVVSGSVEPFMIAGGVPAKPIRKRFSDASQADVEAVRWWDFDIPYIAQHLPALQALAVDRQTAHVYRKPQPRLVMSLRRAGLNVNAEIRGFLVDGAERPIMQAPQKVQDYLSQISGKGPHYWLADMWAD